MNSGKEASELSAEDNSLSVKHRNFQFFLSGLGKASQNPYVRTCERYHTFCTLAGQDAHNVNSVLEFLRFTRSPPEYNLQNNESIAYEGTILNQHAIQASTLWTTLSHLKAYFNHNINRKICNEKPLLNTIIQQWEKTEQQKQAKVKFYRLC
jgi:hypothetical protein